MITPFGKFGQMLSLVIWTIYAADLDKKMHGFGVPT